MGVLYIIKDFGLFPDSAQAQSFCNRYGGFVTTLCPDAELLVGRGRAANMVQIKAPSETQLERIYHALLRKN